MRPLLLALFALAATAGCAPRQAIVESEPGRGGAAAPVDQDVLASLQSDLRELADAQEAFRADNGYYAARVATLDWAASAGVRVDIIQGDRNGWSAVASAGEAECGIFHGEVRAPRSYLTDAGQVACR